MFWIWKERAAKLERKIIAAQQEIQVAQDRGKLLFRHGSQFANKLRAFLVLNLQQVKQT
jgi:hypothetical protein